MENISKYSTDLSRVNRKSSELTIIYADVDYVSISFNDYHAYQKNQRYSRGGSGDSTDFSYQSSKTS